MAIERYTCPKCRGTSLRVFVGAYATLTQDAEGNLQTEVGGEHEWDISSNMWCTDCQYIDCAASFIHQERNEVTLIIDLDERGSFRAHVENSDEKSIFEFTNEDEETGCPTEGGLWLIESGFMKHGRDTKGLLEYLKDMGVVDKSSTMRLQG